MMDREKLIERLKHEHHGYSTVETRRDHALLMDFFRKGDAEGAGHAMAIHMHHSMDVMGLKDD